MSELAKTIAKAQRRIKRLERCVANLRDIAADEIEYCVRSHGLEEDDLSIAALQRIVQRANRTLK